MVLVQANRDQVLARGANRAGAIKNENETRDDEVQGTRLTSPHRSSKIICCDSIHDAAA